MRHGSREGATQRESRGRRARLRTHESSSQAGQAVQREYDRAARATGRRHPIAGRGRVADLRSIYRGGYRYEKAGVMQVELQLDTLRQSELDLFDD